MDWLDLLAVQGTLRSLLQHHRSKASILRHSAFLIVQLSQFSSVTQSCLTLCDPMNCSMQFHAITNSQSSLKLLSIESVIPSSHLILCHPLLLLSPTPPASESFPMSQLFTGGGQSTGVSALAHSFQRNPRADLPQNGLVGSPCNPRDSQESSPTPQFKEASILRHSAFNTEIRLITFFAAKDGEALHSQQKQDQELAMAQIINSLLQNSDLN